VRHVVMRQFETVMRSHDQLRHLRSAPPQFGAIDAGNGNGERTRQ
jgi:hypothetical protein